MKNLTGTESITLGYFRDDGDLQVLATLNNNDQVINEITYLASIRMLMNTFKSATGENIVAISKQLAPDYLSLGEAV